jgi:hypothetical protein
MFGYPEFIKSLLEIENPQDLSADFDYLAAFNFTDDDIPHLIRMATDAGFIHYDEFYPVSDFSWLPVHAWRILAQLKNKPAIDALWSLFLVPRVSQVNLYLPQAVAKFDFIDVFESMNNFSPFDFSDNGIALLCEILENFADRSTDNRRKIVNFLSLILERFEEQSDYLNARFAKSLCRLHALQCFELIGEVLTSELIDYNLFSPEEFLIYLRRDDKFHSLPAKETLKRIDEQIVHKFELSEIENDELNHEFLQFNEFNAASTIQRHSLRYLFEHLGPLAFTDLALKVNRLSKNVFLLCMARILYGQLDFITRTDAGTEVIDKLFEDVPVTPSQFGAVQSEEEKRAFRRFSRHMSVLHENSEHPEEDFYFLFLIAYSQILDGQTSFMPVRHDLRIDQSILGLMRRMIEVSHEDAHVLLTESTRTVKPGPFAPRPSVFSIMMSALSQDVCKILHGTNIPTAEEINFDTIFEDDDDFFDKNDTFDEFGFTELFKALPPDVDPHH